MIGTDSFYLNKNYLLVMNRANRPKIFVISEFYLPGFQSGALRTLANLVERLGDRFEFYILTNNFDADGQQKPYDNVPISQWQNIGKAKVYYLPKQKVKIALIKKLVAEIKPQLIYLNSFFYIVGIKTLLAQRFSKRAKIPIIITPKGELADGAMSIKSRKKKVYIEFSKRLGLFEKVIFKVSAEEEKVEVRKFFPNAEIKIAADLPAKPRDIRQKILNKTLSADGILKLVFLSRIDRKKNLLFGLKCLAEVKVKVKLDVFGPVFDNEYWQECLNVINNLPEHIKVKYKGVIKHSDIQNVLFQYDYFFFPTLGENYGHVLVEALLSGLPLIVSNKTPWLNLKQKGIGWDLSLDDVNKWLEVLKAASEMPNQERLQMSLNAFEEGWKIAEDVSAELQNIRVIEDSFLTLNALKTI